MRRAAALAAALPAAAAATAAAGWGGAAAPSSADLRRARSTVPGPLFRGKSFAETNAALNAALLRSGAGPLLAPCDSFGAAELRGVVRGLLRSASPQLSAVYAAKGDRRALRHAGDEGGYDAEWRRADAAPPHLRVVARDALCHEAVMLYVHHLSEGQRRAARGGAAARRLPALPTGARHLTDADGYSGDARVVADAYVAATACSACHGDPDPYPAAGKQPRVPPAAPRWPPATQPSWPHQWTADWAGWVADEKYGKMNFTGRWSYDYAANRLRQDLVTMMHGAPVSQSTYWFADPGPDDESPARLPAGVPSRGMLFEVMTLPGGATSCTGLKYPTLSVPRPDAFLNAGRVSPSDLSYIGREPDAARSGEWVDHWQFNTGPGGNFSVWNSVATGLPAQDYGPTKADGSGLAYSAWANVTVGAPPQSLWYDYVFTQCQVVPAAQAAHAHLWRPSMPGSRLPL